MRKTPTRTRRRRAATRRPPAPHPLARAVLACILAAAALPGRAETVDLFAYQNHSIERVRAGGRTFERQRANLAHLGIAMRQDTGLHDIRIHAQCATLVFHNQLAGGTGLCSADSKFGLSQERLGEVAVATWQLPYMQMIAKEADPFSGAGADRFIGILGSVGARTGFYTPGLFRASSSTSSPDSNGLDQLISFTRGADDTGFNRRQENLLHYWSPSIEGFTFRYAQTVGVRDGTRISRTGRTADQVAVDPLIRSLGLAYERDALWLAIAYQEHRDWTASSISDRAGAPSTIGAPAPGHSVMDASRADGRRIAARYRWSLGRGARLQVGALYERLEYVLSGLRDAASPAAGTARQSVAPDAMISGAEAAMGAFGYRNFFASYIRGGTPAEVQDDLALDAERGIRFRRAAWLVSGKLQFAGPWDVRASYMKAADLKISCGAACAPRGVWRNTGARAFNAGVFYTLPAGTELRLTYSELRNDAQGSYGQAFTRTGLGNPGARVETIALGIAQRFD